MSSRTEEDIKREQFIPFSKKKSAYKRIRSSDNPKHLCYNDGRKNNLAYEHRVVWEKHNKACLLPWSDVHHLNDDHRDNRPENLEAMMHRKHTSLHSPNKKKDMSNRKCSGCGSSTTQTRFYKGKFYTMWYKKSDGFICARCYSMNKKIQT